MRRIARNKDKVKDKEKYKNIDADDDNCKK